jgi:hypothetical protein
MTTVIRLLSVAGLIVGLAACAATAPSASRETVAARDPSCLKQTGSRLPVGATGCAGFGRSYSSDDINRTGATTPGAALPLLDPSLSTGH